MISSEVQRTLVKSPPELWAELSDPAALARHLGELGEIRIVRTEPERVVEWTAEHTTGVVSIKPSGWGTRVTLSATRAPTASAPAQQHEAEAEAKVEVEVETGTSQREPVAGREVAGAIVVETSPDSGADNTDAEPESPAEPEPAAEPESAPEPEPRYGFFARIFRRRRKTDPSLEAHVADPPTPEADPPAPAVAQPAPASTQALVVEPSAERPDAFAAVRQVLAPETFAATHPFAAQTAADASSAMTPIDPATTGSALETGGEPGPDPAPQADGEPSTDIAAELMAAEDVTADEVSAAEVTAVLTAVLDRLGAAHHRPFSRG